MKKEVSEKLPADLDGLQTTLKRLEHALERAHAYVDDVVVSAASQLHLHLHLKSASCL